MTIDFRHFADNVNEAYYPLYKNRKRYSFIWGGAGSAKSYEIGQLNWYRQLTEPGHNLLIAMQYEKLNRKTTFPLMKQIIYKYNTDDIFKIYRGNMTIVNKVNKNEIRFGGLDDVDKLKSTTFDNGPLTDIWIEEASGSAPYDFTQLDLRLRGFAAWPFQMTLSFNPVSIFSYLKTKIEELELTQPEDIFQLHTTYLDNKFAGKEYAKTMENLKDEEREVYRFGKWGNVQGLVFKNVKVDKKPDDAKSIGYGLDWGFSDDPLALVEIFIKGNDVWIDELLYSTGYTNSMLINELRKLKVNRYAEIIADCQEPKSIEDVYAAGYNIHPCEKGPDSILYGINKMKECTLHVTPRSVNTVKEFSSYGWKVDKNGKALPVPVDAFNHAIDAARYRIAKKQKFVGAGQMISGV